MHTNDLPTLWQGGSIPPKWMKAIMVEHSKAIKSQLPTYRDGTLSDPTFVRHSKGRPSTLMLETLDSRSANLVYLRPCSQWGYGDDFSHLLSLSGFCHNSIPRTSDKMLKEPHWLVFYMLYRETWANFSFVVVSVNPNISTRKSLAPPKCETKLLWSSVRKYVQSLIQLQLRKQL